MPRRKIAYFLVVIVVAGVAAFLARDWIERQFFKPTGTTNTQGISQPEQKDIEIIADNLDIPWEVAFLPDGQILLTERPGTLKMINEDRTTIEIEGVQHVGEGGLLGMAVHPKFSENNFIYLYLTTAKDGGLVNRVERYELRNNLLHNKTLIIDNIPGAANHDGGRLAFGPDSKLYVTTGDAGDENQAQNNNSLAGKILRLNDDGTIPDNNPFVNNPVFTLGHRNVQGIAWDDHRRMWATEHGPSGTESGFDELNLIEAGKNYGWPIIRGNAQREGYVTPRTQSGADETWAPAGMAFFGDSLFFAGLRGETLYQVRIAAELGNIELINHFREEYGRLRAVVLGPDDFLYVTTSNTDGRGDPKQGDDKLIRINPQIFK